MTILEYLNNQIANLEDSLQHYTMVDKDKCKEIYIRTDLENLYKIRAVVEAWQVVTNRFEYFEMEEGDVFVNKQEVFAQTQPFDNNDLKIIKKATGIK